MSESLLPKVSQDTKESVAQTIFDEYETDISFIKEYSKHLIKQNPELLNFIIEYVKTVKSNTLKKEIFIGFLGLYKMLESQAEANQMAKDYV